MAIQITKKSQNHGQIFKSNRHYILPQQANREGFKQYYIV